MYNFSLSNVLIDGEIVTGMGSGNPINVEMNSDRVTLLVGAKGETAHAVSNDNSAKFTLKLLHTSSFNSKLQALDGKEFSVAFVDSNDEGLLQATCQKAMVMTVPKQERGKEVTEREWVISLPLFKIQE